MPEFEMVKVDKNAGIGVEKVLAERLLNNEGKQLKIRMK